jgi:hypothetical protein
MPGVETEDIKVNPKIVPKQICNFGVYKFYLLRLLPS